MPSSDGLIRFGREGTKLSSSVVGGGGPPPDLPYSLPSPGQSLAIGTNRARDLAPAGWIGNEVDYSLINSYGSGVYIPHYSTYGAMVWACTGGHQHPDFTGAIAFDFDDATFKIHEHNNGGTRYSPGDNWYHSNETTGEPYYEITGSPGVPCPGHPYQNASYLPPSLGGGDKGSYLVVGRTAMCEGGVTSSGSVYRFDLITNTWSRVTDNLATRAGNETGVIFDEARGRYWYLTSSGSENDSFVPYFRASDWAFRTDASFSGFPPAHIGGGGRCWMLNGLVFLQTGYNTLLGFDPDSAANGVSTITLAGSAGPTLTNTRNRFARYPRTGKFYTTTQHGGTTLERLIPPAGDLLAGTWTHDTVEISPALTAQTLAGDALATPDQYGALIYVSAIDRLAWFPGGTDSPQLLDPT